MLLNSGLSSTVSLSIVMDRCRLLAEKLSPILKEHKEAISETTGRKDVGWVLGWIKVRMICTVRTEV